MTESTLAHDLLRSIAQLNRWATRQARFDVPLAQARLLSVLDELGPQRVTALARADHSSQPTVTGQVDRLAAAGWARRENDPQDARATVVRVTPAGRAALTQMRRSRAVALEPLLERLDEHERARLADAAAILTRLYALASERSA